MTSNTGVGVGPPGPSDVAHRLGAADIAAALGRPAPTEEQRAVIEAPLGNALVVAGAGSGKTETMAARVVWLVANGLVDPGQVLGLTFTRKAATELSHRLGARLRAIRAAGIGVPSRGADPDGAAGDAGEDTVPTVSTYHGYAGALVAEHGPLLGLEPDLRVLSEASAYQLAHEVVQAWTGPMDAYTGALSSSVGHVLALAGELREHLRGVEEVRTWVRDTRTRLEALPSGTSRSRTAPPELAYLAALEQVLGMVGGFEDAKTERGVLDFGDQVALAARLAHTVSQVARAERERYRVVLLDEFQDTSQAQMVLLSSLFGPSTARDAAPVSVTAVGDPHQAIYGWRGASAGALARFPATFAAAVGQPADEHALTRSFRNHTPVLDVANDLAAPLRALTTVPVHALDSRPGADAGLVELARTDTQPEEAGVVADWAAGLWSGEDRRGATEQGWERPSVAVLCRTRAQIQPVVTALRDRDLPVQVVGLGGLLGTPLVRDLVAALAVAEDPTRGPDVLRLLTGSVCRLGAADLDGLQAWLEHRRRADRQVAPEAAAPRPEEEVTLGEVLEHLPAPGWADPRGRTIGESARIRLGGLVAALGRIRAMAGSPLVDVVRVAEQAVGLDLEAASDPSAEPAWSRSDLDAFSEVAAGYARSADRPGLGAFIAWLDAAEDHERGLDRPDLPAAGVSEQAVQVLTVHAAKGLEWDAVAVTGLTERTFPSYQGGKRTPPVAEDGEAIPGDPAPAGWLGGHRSLPYPLRGDHDNLPVLDLASCADLTEFRATVAAFKAEVGAHVVSEERRLAYVAVTRARYRLLLSAHLWAEGAARPRTASRFLLEARATPGVGQRVWCPPPDWADPGENPLNEGAARPSWPVDRSEEVARYGAAADAVAAALADPALTGGRSGTLPLRDAARLVEVMLAEAEVDEPARDVVDLLTEAADRAEARTDLRASIPGHLSTSDVVALAADRASVLEQWRRPMPQPPKRAARLGTSFHAWVERHYGRAALLDDAELMALDPDDLAGLDPLDPLDPAGGATDPDSERSVMAVMREHFLASPWAARVPREVEVPVETTLGGRIVRGRIDAVFPDARDLGGADGGLVIVDWKTGRPPQDDGGPGPRLWQLAAYRVAYARLLDVPLARVRAAFFHARTGHTEWPDLPDERALEELLADLLPG